MATEDWNVLAADCVVISCCCPCLILQIIIYVLLKFPFKLFRKMKEYAQKKLKHRRKEEKTTRTVKGGYHSKLWEFRVEGSWSGFAMDGDLDLDLDLDLGGGCGCCMEEIEKVLEDFSEKGEFAFGSFWGRDRSRSSSTSLAKQEFEFDQYVVQFQVVKVVASFSYS